MTDPQEFKPVHWVARGMVTPVGARMEDNMLSPTTESIEDSRPAYHSASEDAEVHHA